MFRKTLCLILALTLIISVAPTITFAADDVVVEFTDESMSDPYKLTPDKWSNLRDFDVVVDESTKGAGSRLTPNRISEFGDKKVLQVETRAGSNRTWVNAVNKGEPYGAVFTIKASIPSAGWYGVKLHGGVSQYGSDYYVYVNDQYAGFYSFHTTDTSAFCLAGEEKELNTLYLTPDADGKVKIKFCVEKAHYDGARLYLYKLTLSPKNGDVAVAGIESTIPSRIEIGENIDASAYAKMSDGSRVHSNGLKVDASADADNTISMSVKSGNAVSIKGSNDDGTFTGKISADAEGSAVITVNAKVNGTLHSKDYPIEVASVAEPKRTEIEMTRDTVVFADNTAPSDAWQIIGFELVLDKTTKTAARATGVTVPTENGVLKPIQIQTRSGSYSVWYKEREGSDSRRNNMFTIRKEIAAAGYYKVSFTGFKWYAGSDYAVYINGQYAGDYNCYDADATSMRLGEEKYLNTMYLPKGYAEISFRSSKAHYDTPNLLPYKLVFDPVDISTVEAQDAETEIPSLFDRAEVNATARVKMNDGTIRHFGLADNASADAGNTVSITSEDTGIFEVKNIEYAKPETGDVINYTISAHRSGTANLKIEAS